MSVQKEMRRLRDAKSAIASAIAEKGVNVPYGTKLDGMAALIDSIEVYDMSAAALSRTAATLVLDPASTSIGSYAFNGCAKLTELTFKGTPTSISSSAFRNCSKLLAINVPWAEGAVASAPWGAVNATINYNYTGA